MKNSKKLFFIIYCLLTSAYTLSKDIKDITLPPSTVEGFLPNGLHYILKSNNLPKHNVECRLVINVGSVQEQNHQKGGAHFLEHMAFNGSSHFPGGSMVDYFERQGMKYGRDINAFTGFDRTIYWFSLPIDKTSEDIVDSTLLAIGDILCNLTIDAERTKKERGIILEELRGYDTNDNFYTLKIGNNRYAQHMPLGTSEDINSISRETLTEFYNQWYSPQVATVIIVGNIDTDAIEQKIRSTLNDLPAKRAKKPASYPLAYPRGVNIMNIVDSLQHNVKLDIMIPHPTIVAHDINQHVDKIKAELLVHMLEKRIQQRKTKARVFDTWYLADTNHFAITLEDSSEDAILNQLTIVSDELKLLGEKGPEKQELEWFLAQQLKRIKPEHTDKLSAFWCEDFIDYVISGDKLIYNDAETESVKNKLKEISAKDIRDEAREILKAADRVMLAGLLSPSDLHSIDKQNIRSAWQKGNANAASHFVVPHQTPETESVEATCIPELLLKIHTYDSQAVKERTHYDDLSLEELKLANGVTILLRPTFNNSNTVSVTAFARGAATDLPDSLFFYYKDVAGYVDMGGIETIDADTLSDIMAHKGIMMNIGMDNHWHQIMATSQTEDSQLLMNLLYEKMHHPGKDREGFEACIQDEAESFGRETTLSQMMKRDYKRIIDNLVDSLFGNAVADQYREYSKDDLSKLNLDDITDFYKRVFTDPSGLYVVITGHFDTDSMANIAVATFARMQTPANALTPRNGKIPLPQEGLTRKFPNDEPSQTSCNCIFAGHYEPSLKNSLMFKLMRDILQSRLLSVLRERDNIVYSPFVEMQNHGIPQNVCMFRLYIDVRNENFDKMLGELELIVNDLRNNPVDEGELNKMKRSFIVTKRQTLTDTAPAEWTRVLTELIKNGETIADYNEYNEILNSITPADVMEGFRKYIDYQKLVLLYQSK